MVIVKTFTESAARGNFGNGGRNFMELFGIRRSFSRRNRIGHGGYAEICRIAYPLILMSAGNSVMQFVDRKFLAANSTLDVAASMPSGVLCFTLFAFFMVTCSYTSALVAQYHGANDRDGVLGAVWAGLTVALGAGAVITFLVPRIGLALLRRGGHSPELLEREIEYFNALLPSGVFLCLAAPFFAFFSGRGRTLPVAAIHLFSGGLNVLLDYLLIFGRGGFPALGIAGAGIATSVSCGVGLLTVMIWFYAQNQREIPTRARWRFQPELIVRLFRFGAPAGFQTVCDFGAGTWVMFLLGGLGDAALAASVIAMSINNLFFVPLMGLADSTAIVVGQYIGRRRQGIAERAAYRAWRIAALYAFAGAVLYLGFPSALAGIFYPRHEGGGIDFAEVTRLCGGVLTALALLNVCDSVKYVFMGAMRGAGDTLAAFLLNSATAWLLLVPGTVLLTAAPHPSIGRVLAFMVCVGFLDAMLFLWRFRSGKWRSVKMIGGNA